MFYLLKKLFYILIYILYFNRINIHFLQVIFSSRPKLHSSLVLVKGSEKEAEQVQEATQTLINFSCENIAVCISCYLKCKIFSLSSNSVSESNFSKHAIGDISTASRNC